MNPNENALRFASTAALLLGAVAGAALLARRGLGFRRASAPPLDDDFGPIVIDAPPLVLPTVAPFAAPPSLMDRVSMFLGDAVDAVKRAALPRGMRNNNPGNIRWIPDLRRRWRGMLRDDGGGYAEFAEMADGTRALGKQLLKYRERGLDTPQKIIETWAPAIGRDPVTGQTYTQATPAYVAAVARELGIGADQRFDVGARLVELAWAIARHENGAPFDAYAAPGLNRNWTRAEFARWVKLP